MLRKLKVINHLTLNSHFFFLFISNETNIHRRIKTTDVNTAEVTKDTYTSSSITLTESFVNTENNCVHNNSTQERPNTANITEPEKAKAVKDAEVAKRKGNSPSENIVNTEKNR